MTLANLNSPGRHVQFARQLGRVAILPNCRRLPLLSMSCTKDHRSSTERQDAYDASSSFTLREHRKAERITHLVVNAFLQGFRTVDTGESISDIMLRLRGLT
jgi:hypothetical protein